MRAARRHIALRTCVSCRQRDGQASLLRLVVDELGRIVRAPRVHRAGRSAYVHARSSCLTGLTDSRSLGRTLRINVTKPMRAELLSALRAELCRV